MKYVSVVTVVARWKIEAWREGVLVVSMLV